MYKKKWGIKMLFKDYKVEGFIEELSSSLPSPGGGSAAGLVSALAGSLNSMVYSLTVGKKAFLALDNDKQNLVLEFEKKSKSFIEKSIELMENDRKYFNELMDSYKLPKESEEEKEIRKKTIDNNTIKAMKAPYELVVECLNFYENIDIAVKYGNKMLLSDAGVAALFLHAALESAAMNVKINLNSLRNIMDTDKIVKELDSMVNTSMKRKNSIVNIVNNSIYPIG